MPKIAVITDTDSSLPPDLAEQYGIQLVPITIHFEDHSYTSGLDIDDRLLFQLVDHYNKLPTTSAPSPSAFSIIYENAFSRLFASVFPARSARPMIPPSRPPRISRVAISS
jgi:fatty acid-binding protein DegV